MPNLENLYFLLLSTNMCLVYHNTCKTLHFNLKNKAFLAQKLLMHQSYPSFSYKNDFKPGTWQWKSKGQAGRAGFQPQLHHCWPVPHMFLLSFNAFTVTEGVEINGVQVPLTLLRLKYQTLHRMVTTLF